MKSLAVCLVLIHLAAAELGFPFQIPTLQQTITNAIGTGIRPLQPLLTRREIPSTVPHYADLKAVEDARIAFVTGTSGAVQQINQALLKAVQDAKTKPADVINQLSAVLNAAGTKLQAVSSAKALPAEFQAISSRYSQLATKASGDVTKLRTHVTGVVAKAVGDATANQQKVQANLTQGGALKTLGELVGALMKTVQEVVKAVQQFDLFLQKLSDNLGQYQNSLDQQYTQLNGSITGLDKNLKQTKSRLASILTNANSSVPSSYTETLANPSIRNNTPIMDYIKFISTTLGKASNLPDLIESAILNPVGNGTVRFVKSYNENFEINYKRIVGAHLASTLDAAKIDSCVTGSPIFNDKLQAIMQMAQSCVDKCRNALPMIRQVVDRMMTIMITYATSPAKEFTLCMNYLTDVQCVGKLFEQHFQSNQYAYPAIEQIVSMGVETGLDYTNDGVYRMENCFDYMRSMLGQVFNESVDVFTGCLK